MSSPEKWHSYETVPKDKREILVAKNNGCGWEYYVVYWQNWDLEYPWAMNGQAFFPEMGFDYWKELTPPYVDEEHE